MTLTQKIKSIISNLETSVYIDNDVPSTAPSNTCLIKNIMGRPLEEDLESITYFQPSINIYIRDEDYNTAYERLNALIILLNDVNEYQGIKCITPETYIIPLPLDEFNRTQCYCNFQIKYNNL